MRKQLEEAIARMGVNRGDDLLVHSSFKSLGTVDGGIKTLIEALLSCVGDEGTLLVPSLTYANVTPESPVFDVRSTPACIGAVPEFFRTYDGVLRSLHPTHSVCALGRRACEYVSGHENDSTPVGVNSPLYKLPHFGGKILFIGCTIVPNTSMHGVEEYAGAPYVLSEQAQTYKLTDRTGKTLLREHRRHAIAKNGKRTCFERLDGVIEIPRGKILQAECRLVDAAKMWKAASEKIKADPYYFVENL